MGTLKSTIQRLVAVTAVKGLQRRSPHDEGQTFVEYALILAILAIGAVAALTLLSTRIGDLYSTVNAAVGSVL